jgi:hypothetical protein
VQFLGDAIETVEELVTLGDPRDTALLVRRLQPVEKKELKCASIIKAMSHPPDDGGSTDL